MERCRTASLGASLGASIRASLALVLAMLALAGCATPVDPDPPRSRYHGHPVEQFFARWGAPVAQRSFGEGWTMYLWYTGRNSAYVPGHTDSELIGNTSWWEGYRLRRYDPRLECGLRIVAGPDGTVVDILVHESSVGWWQAPRCRTVLGPPVPA